uniref:Expressed protein n=1 Tax=Schizophyllum commune (strain H4-8 / FGSC 9210) TaxID=578458 RepID=D8PZX9_SCHCM
MPALFCSHEANLSICQWRATLVARPEHARDHAVRCRTMAQRQARDMRKKRATWTSMHRRKQLIADERQIYVKICDSGRWRETEDGNKANVPRMKRRKDWTSTQGQSVEFLDLESSTVSSDCPTDSISKKASQVMGDFSNSARTSWAQAMRAGGGTVQIPK